TERIRLRVRNNGADVRKKLLELDQVENVHAEENGLHIIEAKLGSNLQDKIARLALDNDWGIVELNPVAMTLEDIFLKLTTEEKGVTV
ncbi:MAG: ABC transporter ATP-binding protein, partial [Nitrospinales bacterium]